MIENEQTTRNDGPALAQSDKVATVTKPATKKTQLIKLLRTKAGADIATIGDRFGWQPHTVRASLSGLRKAGHRLEKAVPRAGNAPHYRIVPGEAAAAAKPDSHGG